MPILTIWSVASWRSMSGLSPRPLLLIYFGTVLIMYYIGVVVVGLMNLTGGGTLGVIVLIVTSLQIAETSAFLGMVNFMIDALQEDYNNKHLPNTSQFERI